MSQTTAWIILVIGGLFEIAFASSMKLSNNFKNFGWSITFMITLGLSVYLLNKATEVLPLGLAYAVWTGIGALGTTVVSLLVMRESMSAAQIGFLLLLITALIGLKWAS